MLIIVVNHWTESSVISRSTVFHLTDTTEKRYFFSVVVPSSIQSLEVGRGREVNTWERQSLRHKGDRAECPEPGQLSSSVASEGGRVTEPEGEVSQEAISTKKRTKPRQERETEEVGERHTHLSTRGIR